MARAPNVAMHPFRLYVMQYGVRIVRFRERLSFRSVIAEGSPQLSLPIAEYDTGRAARR